MNFKSTSSPFKKLLLYFYRYLSHKCEYHSNLLLTSYNMSPSFNINKAIRPSIYIWLHMIFGILACCVSVCVSVWESVDIIIYVFLLFASGIYFAGNWSPSITFSLLSIYQSMFFSFKAEKSGSAPYSSSLDFIPAGYLYTSAGSSRRKSLNR